MWLNMNWYRVIFSALQKFTKYPHTTVNRKRQERPTQKPEEAVIVTLSAISFPLNQGFKVVHNAYFPVRRFELSTSCRRLFALILPSDQLAAGPIAIVDLF